MSERAWYGPLSPWITDAEKNDAINRMDRQLAEWRRRNAMEEAGLVEPREDETTAKGA